MPISRLLLALAGYRPAELASHPFCVTHRRLGLGALALGSATIGAVLLGIAVSRIDPSHGGRHVFGALAGLLYFVMLLSFDALFIVGVHKPSRRAIAARIALSLMVTAFSSVTLDALIAGKRLNAEIDARKLDADLAARARHGQVHDLQGKQSRLSAASAATAALERRLQADPESAEFVAARQRANATDQALRAASADLEPRLADARAQLAQLQVQLQGLDAAEDRSPLRLQMAELRVRRDNMAQHLREAERAAREAAAVVGQIRAAWQSDLRDRLQESRVAEAQAQGQLAASQRLAEDGAATSRAINEGAFEANVVEQTAAFWGLAARDKAYLVMGVVVWMCCIALELLAVLVKLQLKPDAADLARLHDDSLQAQSRAAQLQFQATVGQQAQQQLQVTRLQGEAAGAELQMLATVHARSAQLVVEAWRARQVDAQLAEPRMQAELDRQFSSLQSAMSAKLDELLARLGPSSGTAPAGSAAAAGEPTMVAL